jgi:CBS domain-containing protein
VGIISDRDVQRYSPSVLEPHTEEEYNQVFEATPITKVMTRKPIMVRADAPLAEAVHLLYTKRIGALLVGKNGELEGILSVTDLLGVLLEQLTGANKTKSASGMA